ncbi:hypothetical protein EVAR_75070_1 [Eumeta japonica]|uniref:Uncharacterized protein n=1 Tax=Eumeta variegata TaxID=151549 RepID=A0A4C1W0M4_EUMVA|nr:hypothetical protein EVAR_75070_1 [Eumeta japonica]
MAEWELCRLQIVTLFPWPAFPSTEKREIARSYTARSHYESFRSSLAPRSADSQRAQSNFVGAINHQPFSASRSDDALRNSERSIALQLSPVSYN